MLNDQLIIAIIGAAVGVSLSIILSWVYRSLWNNTKVSEALKYLEDYSVRGEGSPFTLLALIANTLNRQDRQEAIWRLVSAATLNNKREAFLAIRDHIRPKDLRDMLKNWGSGDVKRFVQGEEIGRVNGMKILCFAAGTRTIQHLDSDITATEHKVLQDKFGIFQPLKVVGEATG